VCDGFQVRFKRGYQNVISKGIELNDAGVDTPLMIETSGHGAMRDNYFLDDGAYLAVKVSAIALRIKLRQGVSVSRLCIKLRD